MEVAVANAGLRQSFRAFSWALNWATVREAIGHDPTVEEVAEWWNASVRTTFREQAAFRKAFPTLESPGKIFEDPEARSAIKAVADLGGSGRNRKVEQAIVRLGTLPAQ